MNVSIVDVSSEDNDVPNRPSLDSTVATIQDEEDNGNALPYWEEYGWVPLQKNGKQRTPNMIRNELQRYIDNTAGVTATSMCRQLCVNSNSFRKFMNPQTYKNPWSAIQNGTYWAAAKFLEEQRSSSSKKRKPEKSTMTLEERQTAKKLKTTAKADALALMERIAAFQASTATVSETVVYDSCPELIKKCKDFLAQDGVTKADFCRVALGGVNNNSLNPFLASKNQDKAASIAYKRAWVFFESKRLMEGTPKTKARLRNEAEHPHGFELKNPNRPVWVIVARNPSFW